MVYIKVKGKLETIKTIVINELEALYDTQFERSELVPFELAERLADLTNRIEREIAVLMDRKGHVREVVVGDAMMVGLKGVDFDNAALRCIHTHPNGNGMLSDIDLSALKNLRLEAIVSIGVDSEAEITGIYAGLIEGQETRIYGPFQLQDAELDRLSANVEKRERSSVYNTGAGESEKVILVGIESEESAQYREDLILDELEELSKTAGAVVVGKVVQKKRDRDPAYLIGRGKAEEINLLRQKSNAGTVIFDDELSGAQVRNLEAVIGAKVIDRTMLILDIFAQRARSREGKLQVELAQLKYRLPRLMGLGTQLSRLGGGIGTRGPGEKKLEVDRRHIRRRISMLETEMKGLDIRRGVAREKRRKSDIPVIALVGYTNAGKSSLMNRLSSSEVFVENRLFATLDPTIRKVNFYEGNTAMLIDTVGFIKKLPHELIEAFKSTLEEAVSADLLIHVADGSSPDIESQIAVVDSILESLGATGKQVVLAINKVDLFKTKEVATFDADAADLKNDGDNSNITGTSVFNERNSRYEAVCKISALTGQGIGELMGILREVLFDKKVEVQIIAPYKNAWVISYLHNNGSVLSEEYTEDGIRIKALMVESKAHALKDFRS